MSAQWRYTGNQRPAFAEVPGAGQESVWDYPRPPRLVPDTREVVVRIGDQEFLRTRRALRILETASPPTFYLPLADARLDLMLEARDIRSTACEWKGSARYWTLIDGDAQLKGVAWSYPSPNPPFQAIANCFSVYPGRVACFVDGERVKAQDGGFYGGWVTSEIAGPWKGAAGTAGW